MREMLPRELYGPRKLLELLEWLEDTQERNERARPRTKSAAPPPLEHRQAFLPNSSL